jgi:hypothetical protein
MSGFNISKAKKYPPKSPIGTEGGLGGKSNELFLQKNRCKINTEKGKLC